MLIRVLSSPEQPGLGETFVKNPLTVCGSISGVSLFYQSVYHRRVWGGCVRGFMF